MKFICEKNVLLKNLQASLSAISPKTMLPYLNSLLLEAEGKEVTVTATDLEISTKVKFKADIKSGGKVLVHGDLLLAITKTQEDKDIIIEEAGDTIKITCEKFHANVPKRNIDEYPQIPEFPKKSENQFSLPAMELLQLIKETAYAASREETRYVLCSEYFEVEKGNLTVVATDGKRLSMSKRQIKAPKTLKTSVIIPIKGINVLQRFLSLCEEKEEIKIVIQDNAIFFSSDGKMISSRVVDGTYPDYKSAFPKSAKVKVEVEREELLGVIMRTASIFHAGMPSQTSSVKFQIKKNTLTVSASSPGFGEAEEDIQVQTAGGSLNVSFNPGYFVELLRHIDSSKVVIEMVDSLSATVVKAVDDPNFVSLIMPMRS